MRREQSRQRRAHPFPLHHVRSINKAGKSSPPSAALPGRGPTKAAGRPRALARPAEEAAPAAGVGPAAPSPPSWYLGSGLVMHHGGPPFRLFQTEIAEVTVSANPPPSAARAGVPARQAGEQAQPMGIPTLVPPASPVRPSPPSPPRGTAECNK